MSILIKDISIPKYGELNITIDALGNVAYTDKDMKARDIIEIPTPHGDLIDKNIVLYEIYQYMYNRDYAVGHLYDVISYAVPVTVESEE